MIARIEGELVRVSAGRALLRLGGLTYEVLYPATDEGRLERLVGRTVSFETLHYLDGGPTGGHIVPRLLGFANEEERAFFELLTTVKGIGPRKALRALAQPIPAVAQAIAEQDVAFLTELPEIGRRTADAIVTELKGKVDRFVELKPGGPGQAAIPGFVQDALAVLRQLGEPPVLARQLVDRARQADPALSTADALVAAAYRLKALAEV
ncbi:MAG: hypothetical protein KF817_09375 [Phycisphaeraceae bacterium]|nr:hypothetical protein [Phycisphaeraceae bacterium]